MSYITFSKLGSFGRFGNAIWQYASLRGIGLKTGKEIKIPGLDISYHEQDCLLKHFKLPVSTLSEADNKKHVAHPYLYYDNYTKPQFFDKELIHLIKTTNKDVDILGYFQNLAYFHEHRDVILEDLQFQDTIKTEAETIFNALVTNFSEDTEFVSIHVKRGELVNETEQLGLNFYGSNGVYLSYLAEAIEYMYYIRPKIPLVFLVFTNSKDDFNQYGTTDNPLKWCQENITGDNILYSTGHSTIIDFALMTLCNHNVLCHSSTFGWWSAYLNRNPNKYVIAPKYWFMDRSRFVDGYFPKDWVLL